jgi:hypothetical protein
MKKIYKYKLETTDVQQIEMPQGAQVLCVQTQDEIPCIWAIVDPNAALKSRTFEIYGTGHDFPKNEWPDRRRYVGTYQLRKGALVFHCFEIEKFKV